MWSLFEDGGNTFVMRQQQQQQQQQKRRRGVKKETETRTRKGVIKNKPDKQETSLRVQTDLDKVVWCSQKE